MSDIQIIENLLPKGYADQIEQDLLQWNFPWYYVNDVTNVNYGDNSGLVHLAYNWGDNPSEWYPFIKPIVYSIEEATKKSIDKLLRIRIGFLPTTNQPDKACNTPHVDFLFPHLTACYYVNDSDGDTILYEQFLKEVGVDINNNSLKEYTDKTTFTVADQCTPKKNRLCVFDGERFHASSKPKSHTRRLVITVNYTIKDNNNVQ